MGIINRFLLFFYGLAVGVLSLCVAAACLKFLPEHIWANELRYVVGQQEALMAALTFLVLSLYFVSYSFFFGTSAPPPDKDFVLVKSGTGDVRILMEAVCNLVEREARAVAFVRDVKAQVKAMPKEDGNPFRVGIRLVLLSGANVPHVSGEVASRVKTQLRQSMDLLDVPVEVTISDISNAPVEKRRVV